MKIGKLVSAVLLLLTGFGVVALSAYEGKWFLMIFGMIFGAPALLLVIMFGQERGKKEWQGRVMEMIALSRKIYQIEGGISFVLRDENRLLWSAYGPLDKSGFIVVPSDNGKFLVPCRLVSSKSDVAEKSILQEVV